ncbi:hypothetical protein ACFFIX_04190 [Metabacillus herbersteinensis]|uniref:Uncharacterized protein n=1 Tax=Metabacillus herbersteinensis TaxID=283816 RepID=A0ABV6GAD4_9BACI
MAERDQVQRIKDISEDIVRKVLRDDYIESQQDMKKTIELLARSVYDFSVIHLDPACNKEETLKGTLSKVKISHNTVSKINKQQVLPNT